MSDRTHDLDQLPTQVYLRLKQYVERFEDAWHRGLRPNLEEFLPPGPGERRAVLVELVHGELELRLKAGEPAAAEDYLKRFPELATDPAVGRALKATEAKFRDREPNGQLPPAQGPAAGGRLGGYRVQGRLGAGGMGVVYLARDEQLDRPVALKVLRPALAADSQARQRFLREARAMAAVKHPHVVTVYQVGEEGNAPFLAMEVLEGESLEARLSRTGRLPLAEGIRIGREIAEGLAAAHQRGLIHRDIKPANIWLEAPPPLGEAGAGAENIKILDFGLARAAGDDAHLTESGAIVGTPAFMSPEQAQGRPVDARCDLFSLGCVLYRACTGQPPFWGPDPVSTLVAVTSVQPPPPRQLNPELPPVLDELVMELLAKDPAARPTSARAVADRLRAIAEQPARVFMVLADTEALSAVSPDLKGGRRGWKSRALVGGGALLLLLSLGLFFREVWFGGNAREEEKVGGGPDPGQPKDLGPGKNRDRKRARAGNPDDRPVAEWVLSLGGDAFVRNGKGNQHVRPGEALPAGALVLEFVDLRVKAVNDNALVRLKGLTQLNDLLVNGSGITDRGMEHLKGLVSLRRLVLNSTQVGDAGLKHLRSLTGLRLLDLNNTKVTAGGVVALQQALPRCRILSAFDVDCLAAHWVLSLGGEISIWIDRVGITYPRTARDLPATPYKLFSVYLNGKQVKDAGLLRLQGLANLTSLRLYGSEVTDAGLIHLKSLTNLQELWLGSSGVTNAGLKNLRPLTALKRLQLAFTRISDAGLVHLKGFPNLESVHLAQCRWVTDAGLGQLQGLAKLTELGLDGSPITDAGLERLKVLRPNLTVLSLGSTNITNAGLEYLKDFPKLKSLGLQNTRVSDAGLKHLKGLPNLTELGLAATGVTDVGLERLKGLTGLRKLDLSRTPVTAWGVAALQKALPNCSILSAFVRK
jgi:Leucine-rich repeat (LRR) protein